MCCNFTLKLLKENGLLFDFYIQFKPLHMVLSNRYASSARQGNRTKTKL